MTEELEKEAIAKYKTGSYPQLHPDHYAFIHGYLAGAEPREKRIAELEAQIDEMKKELHHRLVSPSHDDSDCLDKIVGLDRLWQFGKEF